MQIDRAHLQRIKQFDARDGNAGLDGQDSGPAARFDRGKRTHAARYRFRNAGELERQLGDDAKRAFRADDEPREIVTGAGFLSPARRRHPLAVGKHGFQRKYIVPHGAVAHRVSARGAGRRHAAERSIGAGIDWKEDALIAELLVERLARDAGLDDAVEILGVNREQAVHVAEIERDAPARRIDLAFERSTDAKRDHWHARRGAQPHHLLHIFGGLREHHRIRWLIRYPSDRIAVLLANRLRGDEPVAELRGAPRNRAGDRLAVAFLLGLCLGQCHRLVSHHSSGLKPDALTAGAHFSESSFWMSANAAADVPVGCKPNARNRCSTSDECTASTIALLSRSITSGGVFAGANMPYQPDATRS